MGSKCIILNFKYASNINLELHKKVNFKWAKVVNLGIMDNSTPYAKLAHFLLFKQLEKT